MIVASSSVGPTFLKEPPARIDFANDTGARVDCSAGGSPPPNISWQLGDGKSVVGIPQTTELLSNGSLLFLPFRPSGYRHDVHAATYRCVAANSVGRILSRDVRVRAVVLQYYEVQVYYNKNVVRGNTAVLKCTIPSFVREYITVTSWVQDSSFNIYPSTKGVLLSSPPSSLLGVSHGESCDGACEADGQRRNPRGGKMSQLAKGDTSGPGFTNGSKSAPAQV
uniref:Ig-like domain-containing protein n=1 Tax=Timema bartmani TaxID=61472 RepID=A0A7R9EW11_9NEOP|nr:unnamed protein product [Timema bartmani]